jgi:hypothetical protein
MTDEGNPVVSFEGRFMGGADLVILSVLLAPGQTPPTSPKITITPLPASSPLSSPTPPAPPAPTPEAAKPAAVQEKLTSFDNMGVLLNWSGKAWQLTAQGKVIKDFGRSEVEARQALRLIHELRLNQYGAVGGPQPALEYWLSSGQAPHGMLAGTATLPIDPATLRVEQRNGQWVLRDGARVLSNFGPRESDARQGLAVLQKYGFNQVAMVGGGGAGMQVFLTRPDLLREHGLVKKPGKPTPQPNQDIAQALGAAALSPPHVVGVEPTPAPAPAPKKMSTRLGAENSEPSERVPFDWRHVQLSREGGDWTLRAGRLLFANFGGDERDARLALTALQYYRVNEQRVLGQEPGAPSYFLSNGRAPSGVMLGASGLTLTAEALTVAPSNGGWAVCCHGQAVLPCNDGDEARRMLEAIKQYKFDRVCRFGPPDGQGLTLLVRTQ